MRTKGIAEEAIKKLEFYVNKCDPSTVIHTPLCTTLAIKQELDITETSKSGELSVSKEGILMLKKINDLERDFVNKCSCMKMTSHGRGEIVYGSPSPSPSPSID